MIKIELTNALNGVIKKVIDTQYNGADQSAELVTLYELPTDDEFEYYTKLIKFVQDLTKDLGLQTGSDWDGLQLQYDLDWGDKYNPSLEEVDERIKEYQKEIKSLKEYKKLLDDNGSDI